MNTVTGSSELLRGWFVVSSIYKSKSFNSHHCSLVQNSQKKQKQKKKHFKRHIYNWQRWKLKLTHESSGVGDISADLAVDLDEPLHADLLNLVPSQGILEAVPQKDDEGQALPQLVGTGGRTRSLKEKSIMLDQIEWMTVLFHMNDRHTNEKDRK